MKRRTFLKTAIALGLTPMVPAPLVLADRRAPLTPRPSASADTAGMTRWTIAPAAGLDACFALVIAAAGPDVLQTRKHKHRRQGLRDILGPDGTAAAERLMQTMAGMGKRVPGAGLALMASVGGIDTLDNVRHTFATPGVFERGFAGTRFYQRDGALDELEVLRPIAADALDALAAAGFDGMWREQDAPRLLKAAARLGGDLVRMDIIAEHRRYLTRPLDPHVTIYFSELSEPHGIRILGQRFITSPNYAPQTVLRNAVHEIIHPLLDTARAETARILTALEQDDLLVAIVAKSDPKFGYSSIRGLLEEGGTQALEAVINDRLGVARDLPEYWRRQDGGIHLFAAAVYALMRETGFADTGGDMLAWMDGHVRENRLRGPALRRLAASVVGQAAVSSWLSD